MREREATCGMWGGGVDFVDGEKVAGDMWVTRGWRKCVTKAKQCDHVNRMR
jgi:hypothetical protein